ncbi:SUN domain-containing protein 3-like [Gallus gallus]|uniref:SUN domain-containing protein 3-like n=1 Tax=Gallus gallus TaxID=9031 RepID=UPI001AEA1F8A|nr:SUN domain-containing protein 3-like [Gallus gallus]
MATWKTNVLQELTGLPGAENENYSVLGRKGPHSRCRVHSLKDNGIDGLKREEILQLTREAVEKVMKHDTWLPSWALKTMGATIDVERTSKSYGGNRWLSPFFSSAKPPETILQPDISAGNCWAFQGSRGHVVIRLPEKIWPTAFTIWHISKAVSPSGKSALPPESLLSREWMRTKVKLSWGHSFMTWTERSPRPSKCRRSPAKPSARSNWRCGATGETRNTPACTEPMFTATQKRHNRYVERNN